MERFEELKNKYAAVLSAITQKGVKLDNLDVRENRLFVRGAAPNEAIKNAIWDKIKEVDPTYADLNFDIGVNPSLPVPTQTYVVKPGDSLWQIAQQFYGKGNLFQNIIDANPGKLKDANSVIHPGDELRIPV